MVRINSSALVISLLLTTSIQADPTKHSHDGRLHIHKLPAEVGLQHRHNGGGLGSSVNKQSSEKECSPNINIATGSSGNITVNCKPAQKTETTSREEKPQDSPKEEHGTLTHGNTNFLLKGCSQIGSNIKCTFTVWVIEEDKKFRFNGLRAIRLFDIKGNEYQANTGRFGDVKMTNKYTSYGKELIRDIKVDGYISIGGVTTRGDKIPLLKIPGGGVMFSFRDIKL